MRPFPLRKDTIDSGTRSMRRGRREIATVLHNNYGLSSSTPNIAYRKGPLSRSYQHDYQQIGPRSACTPVGERCHKVGKYSGQNARLAYFGGRVAMTDALVKHRGYPWAPNKRANGSLIVAHPNRPVHTLAKDGTCGYPIHATSSDGTIGTVGNVHLASSCWPTTACTSGTSPPDLPARGYVPPNTMPNCLQENAFIWQSMDFNWFRFDPSGNRLPVSSGNFHLCDEIIADLCSDSEEESESGEEGEPEGGEGEGGEGEGGEGEGGGGEGGEGEGGEGEGGD